MNDNMINMMLDELINAYPYGVKNISVCPPKENCFKNECVCDNCEPRIPRVEKIFSQTRKCRIKGEQIKQKDGTFKNKYEDKIVTTYWFDDGTFTTITLAKNEKNDPLIGLMYATMKRLYGNLNDAGFAESGGFMNYMHKVISKTITPETEEKAKQERIKKMEKENNMKHEEALAKRAKNPSLGLRLANLESKFEKFLDAENKAKKK